VSRFNSKHPLAVWAGVTTLLTNFAAINLVRLLGDTADPGWQAVGSIVTALFVAGSVYSKQRWDEAKAQKRKRPPRRAAPPDG
jgi:hypothetical protein